MRLTQVCSRISEGSSNVQTEGKATDSKQKNVTVSIKRDLFDDGITGGAMTPWDKAAKPLQQRILKQVKPVGPNYLHYWWRYLPQAGLLQKISIKNFTCFEDRNTEKCYFVLVKNICIFWYKGLFPPTWRSREQHTETSQEVVFVPGMRLCCSHPTSSRLDGKPSNVFTNLEIFKNKNPQPIYKSDGNYNHIYMIYFFFSMRFQPHWMCSCLTSALDHGEKGLQELTVEQVGRGSYHTVNFCSKKHGYY